VFLIQKHVINVCTVIRKKRRLMSTTDHRKQRRERRERRGEEGKGSAGYVARRLRGFMDCGIDLQNHLIIMLPRK